MRVVLSCSNLGLLQVGRPVAESVLVGRDRNDLPRAMEEVFGILGDRLGCILALVEEQRRPLILTVEVLP